MARDQWRDELRDLVNTWVSGNEFVKESAYVKFLAEVNKAHQRGHEAGSGRAGYRLVQENERLRRELELLRKERA